MDQLVVAADTLCLISGILGIVAGILAQFEVLEKKHHQVKWQLWPWPLLLFFPFELLSLLFILDFKTLFSTLINLFSDNAVINRNLIFSFLVSVAAFMCVKKIKNAHCFLAGLFIILGIYIVLQGVAISRYHDTVIFNHWEIAVFSITLLFIGGLQLAELSLNHHVDYKLHWAYAFIFNGFNCIYAEPKKIKAFEFNAERTDFTFLDPLSNLTAAILSATVLILIVNKLYPNLSDLTFINQLRTPDKNDGQTQSDED